MEGGGGLGWREGGGVAQGLEGGKQFDVDALQYLFLTF